MCGIWTRSLLKVIASRETTSGSGNLWALMEAKGSMRLSCFVHVVFLVASSLGSVAVRLADRGILSPGMIPLVFL